MADSSPQASMTGPESAAPAPSAPGTGDGTGTPPVAEPRAANERAAFARRLDDPQRVDGGGRWSVDATRRRCARCAEPLPDGRVFHSVLEPPPPGAPHEEQEVFVRRDYCEECHRSGPPERAFAHWRAVLPPPPGGVRKIVNLASLLAHFHTLVEGSAKEAGAAAAVEASAPATAEAPRLIYLLALFLVRRRMLRWEGVEDRVLRLRCRESDRLLEVAVPALPTAELEAAVAEFEELFR
jgi:hypothetical protein